MTKLLQWYLKFWTKYYLKRAKPKIVAITGSVGKTSTKEAIFEVLKIKFGQNIRKSEGNLNCETGVPLAIFGFKKSPQKFYQWLPVIVGVKFRALFQKKFQVLVLELAADKPGDIKYLTSFIKPNIACITSIAPAHLQAFGTLENIVQEKTDLIKALSADGWAILNIDQESLRKLSFGGRWQTLTYAIEEKAEIMAKNITTEINRCQPETKFQIAMENAKFRVTMPTLGRVWNVYAALAAAAVGTIFEMKPSEIVKGFGNIRPAPHRMEVLPGKNNTLIIDDSYNANPLSMKAALDVLKFLAPAPGGRKIAVIGDMLEIGKISKEAHKLIGQYAKEMADIVVAVGKEARFYQSNNHFQNTQEAGDYLLEKSRKNDIILIKASREVGLDRIVEALRANR